MQYFQVAHESYGKLDLYVYEKVEVKIFKVMQDISIFRG